MNSKSLLIATVSGFVVMFFLSWFGHELLMPLFYDVHPMESLYLSDVSMPGIAFAYIVLALLMSYAYPKGVEAGSTLRNGLSFGIFIGLVFTLPVLIIFNSYLAGFTIKFVILESVWHIIEQGIGGIVIAYTYAKITKG